jgi:hypothetical protein
MKPIIRRIQKLEERLPPPEPAPEGPPFVEQLREGFARIGFARGKDESLMETFARFLGIAPRELRAQLQLRATGKPAEFASDIGS